MRMRPVATVAVAMTALAASSAPAAPATRVTGPTGTQLEITKPQGASRGVVIVLHGGGWNAVGPAYLPSERRTVRLVARSGWTAVNADYRSGRRSIGDTLAIYRWTRRRFGRSTPVCSAGSSAGGHLALMLASLRDRVRCTIARAAPTDLAALEEQNFDLFIWAALPYFGDDFARWSPVTYARTIRAEVLLGTARRDSKVPPAQQAAYLRANPRARGVILRPGRHGFIHAQVALSARKRFDRLARGVLRRAARP